MATLKLYEIIDAIENFQFETDEDGVITNAEALDELELAKETKVENIILLIKSMQAEAEAVKVEKDKLAKREKSLKTNADSLKNYIKNMLQGETFKTARCSISYRKSEALQVADWAIIPENFYRFKDPEIDKTTLKQAIKDGLEIDGVEIVTNNNIQIK